VRAYADALGHCILKRIWVTTRQDLDNGKVAILSPGGHSFK